MSFNPAKLASPAVRVLAPYVPGKPIDELERELGINGIVKLASNENPLGPGPRAIAAMATAVKETGLYPDGSGFVLKQAIAKRHGCGLDCITLGNGSNDVLVLLAETFLTRDDEAVFSQYAFAVYPIAVQATGATARIANALGSDDAMPLGHDPDAMLRLINDRTRLVFFANPNNPTGTWVDADRLKKFIAAVPETSLVVIDEAYIEYTHGNDQGVAFPDASAWLNEFPNLVVTRTFSKAFGLAGLRVGYALSHPGVADLLNRARQPFNVNAIALAAAAAALEDIDHLNASVALNRDGMAQLRTGFDRLGLVHLPSAGNFLLVDCGRPAGPVFDALLRQGVIVRPVGAYGLPNHLRITIGTSQQNQRMLTALQQTLQS